VSSRPGWYQRRERPVNDPSLRDHMRLLAEHALRTQEYIDVVTVTAQNGGKSWSLTLQRSFRVGG